PLRGRQPRGDRRRRDGPAPVGTLQRDDDREEVGPRRHPPRHRRGHRLRDGLRLDLRPTHGMTVPPSVRAIRGPGSPSNRRALLIRINIPTDSDDISAAALSRTHGLRYKFVVFGVMLHSFETALKGFSAGYDLAPDVVLGREQDRHRNWPR